MPKGLPTYSTCTGDTTRLAAWEISASNVAWQLVKYVVMNFTILAVLPAAAAVSGVAWLTAWLLNLQVEITQATIKLGCVMGVAALYAFVLFIDDRYFPVAGQTAPGLLQWFHEYRLGCVHDNEVAAGVVVDRMSNDNSDQYLHLALAPFSPAEHLESVEAVYAAASGKQVYFPDHLFMELSILQRDTLINIYQHAVYDHLLASPPDRLFQARFFASNQMPAGMAKPSYIPDDTLKPKEATNPLFRCPWDVDSDAEKLAGSSPVPDASLRKLFIRMPAVIEGNYLGELLEDLRDAFLAAAIAMAIVCGICLVMTGGNDTLCSWLAGLVAFLAWLITFFAKRSGSGGGGSAATDISDLHLADPNGSGHSLGGDSVAVFGDWVMDPAQDKFYAIQPVRAWYLLCRPGSGSAGQAATGMLAMVPQQCGEMSEARYNQIRDLLKSAEVSEVPSAIELESHAALSMLGGFDRVHARVTIR